jgi:hypothetical protein
MKKKKDSMKLKDLLSERAFDGMSMIGNHASPINATGRDFEKKAAVKEAGTFRTATPAEFKAYMKKNPALKTFASSQGMGSSKELKYDINELVYVYQNGKLKYKGADFEKAYTLYRSLK